MASFSFYEQEHSGRVFRLQFDEFQIVSSSHDDTILIWDFLNSITEPAGSSVSNVSNASMSSAACGTPSSRKFFNLFCDSQNRIQVKSTITKLH